MLLHQQPHWGGFEEDSQSSPVQEKTDRNWNKIQGEHSHTEYTVAVWFIYPEGSLGSLKRGLFLILKNFSKTN